MATVWGEAEVALHVDGRMLPGEVRQATEQAAIVGGKQFNKTFKAQMRKAGREGAAELAKSLGNMIQTVVLSSGAFRRLYQATIAARRGFRLLGTTVREFAGNTLRRVVNGVKNLGTALKDASDRNLAPFREGLKQLKISLDDLDQTFPLVRRSIEGVARGFRYVRDEAVGFGNAIRTDSIKTMDMLREGASKLKISLDDVRDTFPGVTKAARGMRTAFRAVGRAAVVVGREVKSLGPDMDFVVPAAGRVRDAWQKLSNTFKAGSIISKEARQGQIDLANALGTVALEAGESSEAIDKDTDSKTRNTRAAGRNVTGTRKLLSAWKRMPHGFRQAVFWITLVTSAMGALSVLTSALSGTIIALVTILGALAAGAGLAVAGFMGLFEEGAKLNAGAAASKKAFEDLGGVFQTLQAGIVNAMFDGMADSIGRVSAGVTALTPALEDFAGLVGDSIGRIFDALSSDSGIGNFQTLIGGFEPIFESMTTAIITFGDAIADILIASLPTAQLFAQAIADVGTQFSTWTSSEEGRARLAEFFDTAERIMPKVVDLVVALGGALSGLVTETTITGVEQFLGSLTNFMPILGELVEVVANLNVFGILAAALQSVGMFLAPLMPPLQELASILGEQLVAGLELLSPAFAALGEALVPVIGFISTLVSAILPPLFDILASGIGVITGVIDIFVALGEIIFGTGEDATFFGDLVGGIFKVLGTVFTVFNTLVGGVLRAIAALLKGDTAGAFKIFEDVVNDVLAAVGLDIDDVISWLSDLWAKASHVFDDISREVGNFARDVGRFFDGVISSIKKVIDWFGSLFGAAGSAKSAASGAASTPRAAAGMILTGPRHILAGEAGPEAIVPLRRSLSQVHPSVRGLSAIAQGKDPGGAGTGDGGNGRTLNVSPGAIVINGVRDPNAAAVGVVNRLAERIAS